MPLRRQYAYTRRSIDAAFLDEFRYGFGLTVMRKHGSYTGALGLYFRGDGRFIGQGARVCAAPLEFAQDQDLKITEDP